MSVTYDKIQNKVMMHKHKASDLKSTFEIVSSLPATSEEGKVVILNTDHKIYIYYNSTWQVLYTLSFTARTPTYASLWFLIPNIST